MTFLVSEMKLLRYWMNFNGAWDPVQQLHSLSSLVKMNLKKSIFG